MDRLVRSTNFMQELSCLFTAEVEDQLVVTLYLQMELDAFAQVSTEVCGSRSLHLNDLDDLTSSTPAEEVGEPAHSCTKVIGQAIPL